MKIYVINGVGGSGKDTFIKLCSKYCTVLQYSTIDLTKHALKEIGLHDGYQINIGLWENETEKTAQQRKLLSDVKNAIDFNGDHSFINITACIDKILSNEYPHKPDVLFITSRQIEEIKRYKTKYHCKTINVVNHDLTSRVCNTEKEFLADAWYLQYDIVIENNERELSKLENKVKMFLLEEKILRREVFKNFVESDFKEWNKIK